MAHSREIKILFFSAHLALGGIEKVLLNYAKGLSEDCKYKIIFLTCKNEIEVDITQLKDIDFLSLNINKIRNCIPHLRSILQELQPDYLITASKWTLYAYIANQLNRSKTKIITSQHNYLSNNPEVSFLHKFTLKFIYPLCYKVIAVSDGIENLLNDKMFCNKKKIVKIYNPIDTDNINLLAKQTDFSIPKDYLLFIGRLSKVKNLEFLISAFAIFYKMHPSTELLIIGEGNQTEILKQLVENIGFKNQIQFLGKKTNPYPFLANARLLCLSSVSEAFPTVLLEALTLGITTVSSPTQGAKEILKNGRWGYLSSSFDNIYEYADKMEIAYWQALNPQVLKDEISNNYSLISQTKKLKNILLRK